MGGRRGRLSEGADYRVIGFGPSSLYPDNFSVHTYEQVGYPHQPGGTADCASCHGVDNEAWQDPAPRDHPDQPIPTQVWRFACMTCHDSPSAIAHAESNTGSSGAETCALCHGPGKLADVELSHRHR